MTNHRIWPGPEDLRGRAHRLAKLAAVHGPFGALTRLGFLERAERAEFDRRSLGIAMGHVRARARMRRFVVWLLSYSACAERAALRTGLSPEGAVRSGSLYELQWLATRVLHGRWREAFREPVNVEAELLALLASPEWLSLPWQRDPSEGVGRG